MESNDPRWPSLDPKDRARIDELINNEHTVFPIQLLPNECKEVINYLTEQLELDHNICSVGILSALANAIGLKSTVKTDFINPPILWISVVARSGYGKTPALEKVLSPIKDLDREAAANYSSSMDAYRLNPKDAQKPKLAQRIISDSTIEALIDVHKQNPNGLLIYVDELMGFINSFGQYKSGKSGEQEQYLSMHDGDTIRVNRKTQDPIILNKSCVSILGGMQPSKLYKFLSDGRSDDGFLYRFLFVFAPGKKKKTYLNKDRNDQIEKCYSSFIKRIAEKNFEVQYQLEEKAQQVLNYWDSQCYDLYENEEFDYAYHNKLIKYVHRFALISQCSNEFDHDHPLKIKASTILLAIETAEFFRTNLNRMIEDFLESGHSNNGERIMKVIANLPKRPFTRQEALPFFLEQGISERTANDHLKRGKYFKKISHGVYELRVKK